jgi:hypothetical protein
MARPNEKIRSEQRFAVTAAALIMGPVFMLGPTALGIGIVIGTKFDWLSLLLLPACVGGSAFIAYHMFQSYQWVELDADVIHGRRFWTRQTVEHRVDQISAIVPLGAVVQTIHNVIADRLLGSIRGYEIRFKDGGRRITLVRHDMANVDALIEALVDRMRRVG